MEKFGVLGAEVLCGGMMCLCILRGWEEEEEGDTEILWVQSNAMGNCPGTEVD